MTREDAIREMMFAKRNVIADSFIDKAYDMAIEALKSQKTGKWITKSNIKPWYTEWWYECSECGQKPLRDGYGQEVLSDYCPNCGARMECEEE